VLLTGCASSNSESQPRVKPWLNPDLAPAITAFEAQDKLHPPEPGQVLFIGSSSIGMWRTVAEDMHPAPVLNRGFGGSTTPEILAVADRIVFPYKPSVIVYYCGDNDLGTHSTDHASAAAGFTQFADLVHKRLPDTHILYMSIKPSIDRWSNWENMQKANATVKKYCDTHSHAEYLDLAAPLLGEDGTPIRDLYLDDGLHLSPEGYNRWTTIVRPRVLAAWKKSQD